MSERRKTGAKAIADFKAQERRRNIITGVALVAVVVLIIGGAVLATRGGGVKDDVPLSQDVVVPTGATNGYGLLYTPEDAGAKSLGRPVKVDLVEDFSCPACRAFEESTAPTLMNLVSQGKVTVEYHMVGFLDDGVVVNNHSKRAASAAYCILEDSGVAGWKTYHDWLYSHQPDEGSRGPSDEELYAAAKDLDLSVSKECVTSERYVPYMEDATDWFHKNFNSTPTLLVDGKEVEADPLALVKAVDVASGVLSDAG